MSELARKSIPALAKAVGETEGQALHHFVQDGQWSVSALRERRLGLTKQAVGTRGITLCLDETGDRKKGSTTDYVARQYLGNVGKIDNGMVSVKAYGVLEQVTFPLLFKVFKPEKRLQATDVYQTKPQLAVELVRTVREVGFQVDRVLADSLYGESLTFVEALLACDLPFVVAIRDNHGVWLGPDQHVRYTRWRPFQRTFSDGSQEQRYLREVIFGQRGSIRYYHLTTDPATLPEATTCLVMTNLKGNLRAHLGDQYGLRTWIEYGFKQCKNELGWADYRLTNFPAIERWWELVFSTYLLVSLHHPTLQVPVSVLTPLASSAVTRHPRWHLDGGWKHTLNNLRLVLQPFLALWFLLPWLTVFSIPALALNLRYLIFCINQCT